MPWVRIDEAIPGGFLVDFNDPDFGPTYANGRVVSAASSAPDWYLSLDPGVIGQFDPFRFRVTVESYAGIGNLAGNVYVPAAFRDIDDQAFAVNTAAPYPGELWPDPPEVLEFTPASTEVSSADYPAILAGGPVLFYHAARRNLEESATETYSMLLEVWQDDPPPPPGPCEELGRVTRVYVSAYQRTRIHESRIHRGERRCLVANFNGAIPLARTIVSATWRTYANNTAGMASARIVGRDVMVDLEGLYAGRAPIRLEATLDNGERYVQEFVVRVEDIGWFPGEAQPSAGPTTLTVTA